MTSSPSPQLSDIDALLADIHAVWRTAPGALDIPPILPPSRARAFLHLCRTHHLRYHTEVAWVGRRLLRSTTYTIPEHERWLVFEQTATACLDVGRDEVAEPLIGTMMRHLPNAARLKRLRLMWMEKHEPHAVDQAMDTQINAHPEALSLRSRRALRRKGGGQPEMPREAGDGRMNVDEKNEEGKGSDSHILALRIAGLVEHLDTFVADVDAWEALGRSYVALRRLEEALFCFEEVSLHRPDEVEAALACAETAYSLSTPEGLDTALRWFALAVRLSGGGRRGPCGG